MSNRDREEGPRSGTDRRTFLKEAGSAALGLGWGLPILTAACTRAGATQATEAGAARAGAEAGAAHQLAMVVDVEKCRADAVREAATEACRRAHNIPRIPDPDDEVKWVWSEKYERVFEDRVHAHMGEERLETPVLVMCNQCTNPPCVRVCPTQATYKRESDGIVMMDMHRCIGCRYCMAACPFGARSFNWRDPRPYVETDANGKYLSDYPTRTRGVVEKCDLCAERLRDGQLPACVAAAATVPGGEGALLFGDVADPSSEVSRVLRERESAVRRAELGTGPNVYYLV